MTERWKERKKEGKTERRKASILYGACGGRRGGGKGGSCVWPRRSLQGQAHIRGGERQGRELCVVAENPRDAEEVEPHIALGDLGVADATHFLQFSLTYI